MFLNLMSCLLSSHLSTTFLFSTPLRSKVYTASSLRFAGCWGGEGGGGGGEGCRLGAEMWGPHCPAAGTMHWMLGTILFRLRQVRCGLQGREVSKVLVPRHHPLALPPHLSKHKAPNFQGVPCRLTGVNVTLSFDY